MSLLYAIDLCGTLVFAMSGAFKAVRYELDLLGIIVLAVATGVGGGLIRDMLLGATPPAVFQDEWYLIVCIAGALAVFFGAPRIAKRWNRVMIADAIGLGVFAGIGAVKALQYDLGPIGVMMMAALTATGGGVVRDVLIREIPAVIQKDFYATAALFGGAALLGAYTLGWGQPLQFLVAGVVTTGLRFYAMITNMTLPRADPNDAPKG